MLIHISLVVALCSGVSMQTVRKRLSELEASNPGSKVTLRIDKKAQCDSSGKILEKKKKSYAENE